MMDMVPFDMESALKWVGTVAVAIAAWTWNRLDARVARLEEQSATKEDFSALRDDVREVRGRVDRVIEMLDE